MKSIPAFDEPLYRIIVDCVGPLTKKKAGNEYLVTIVCVVTRYIDSIPPRRITAYNVTMALVKLSLLSGYLKLYNLIKGQMLCLGCQSSVEGTARKVCRFECVPPRIPGSTREILPDFEEYVENMLYGIRETMG